MTIDELYQSFRRGNYIRLTACSLYVPSEKARDGYRQLDGGRAVYIAGRDDSTGLAVYNREVVQVVKVDHRRWNVALQNEVAA